jgi:hypothetical protein
MSNEICSQRLLQFMQVANNPAMAPFIKYDYILREITTSMDLDEDLILNDPREAIIQVEIMAEIHSILLQQLQPPQQEGPPSQIDPMVVVVGILGPVTPQNRAQRALRRRWW